VKPGQSFDYSFTPRMAGTNWFHPLVPGFTAAQVDRGLTGMLIVEETTPPVVDSEFACFLDDWHLREDGTHAEPFLDPLDAARSGRLGNRLTVNGAAGPEVIRLPPRSRIRLRIINIANARIMPMRFEGVPGASVIAIDGQPTEPFDPLRKQVTLGPGGRFDVMVDFPDEPGKEGRLVIALGDGLPVFRFVAEGAPVEARPKVAPLPDNGLPPAVVLQNAERSVLEIAGGVEAPAPGVQASTADEIRTRYKDPRKIWQLNYGRSDGFGGAPLMRVKSGRPCVLAIVNKSAWAQVIHTHGHHFRYLHPFDDGWEPYWLDTLVVPAGQTIRVAFVAETPGRWAIRSSILEHFESGIATWFEVS
jgi:FtsP/CotA-like multicopper oxidase with cupredoxin domain